MRTFLIISSLMVFLMTGVVFAQTPEDVVIPWQEFVKLWEASQDDDEVVEQPPLNYLLSRGNYTAEVGEDVVYVVAEIEINVLKSGWNTIDLMQKDTPIAEATLDGRPVTLAIQGNRYQLITQETGRHQLVLKIEIPVQRDQGPDFFQFHCPTTSMTFLTIDSPNKDGEFTINGSQAFTRNTAANRVRITKALPTTAHIRVQWTKPVIGITAEEEKDPLVYSEVFTLVSIGEGVMSCRSTISYQILQAGIDQFRFAIPEETELIDINGRAVRDWEKKTVDGQKVVDVYLEYKIKDNFNLIVQYEKNMGGTSAVSAVPVLQVLEVERSKGFIAVEARTNVEISVEKTNLAKLDVKELPPQLVNITNNPILLAFKYIETPFDLTLSVQKHQDLPVLVATVDDAEVVSLATAEGRTITHCTYWVRNNRKQFMKLNLPDGATVWSTFVSSQPVKPAKNEDDQLLLPLKKSEQTDDDVSTFSVEVIYLMETDEEWGKRGKFQAELPQIDIPVSQIRWKLFTPQTYRFDDFDGTIEEVDHFTTHQTTRVDYSENEYDQRPQERSIYSRSQAQQMSNVPSNVPMTSADRKIVTQQSIGSMPVRVRVPQIGRVYYFEKLLVIDEILNIKGKYKEL